LHEAIKNRIENIKNKINKFPNNKTVWDSIYNDRKSFEFITHMDRWSTNYAKITWFSEHSSDNPMNKKSFQTFMSKIRLGCPKR